jgi:hypothetical protein
MDLLIEANDCNGRYEFKIDGLDAEHTMFGKIVYESSEWTCDEDSYTCDPCYFKRTDNPDGKTMDDYCLTIEDWNIICDKLEKELQWDACSDCV